MAINIIMCELIELVLNLVESLNSIFCDAFYLMQCENRIKYSLTH